MFSEVLVSWLITIVFLLLQWYATPKENTWGVIAANCSVTGFIPDKQFKLFAVWNKTWNKPKQFPIFRIMYYAVKDSLSSQKYQKSVKYSISPFHSQVLKVNSPN